jgi:hypothetical protein
MILRKEAINNLCRLSFIKVKKAQWVGKCIILGKILTSYLKRKPYNRHKIKL